MVDTREGQSQENGKERHKERRQQFFKNLLHALRPSSNGKEFIHGTFAACEVIKPSQGFGLTSFHVEGVGDLQLPLSTEDTSKLRDVCKQRMFGKGLAAVKETTVRSCWEVDASKVSFPGMPTFLSETIRSLAIESVSALGLDGTEMQLEAHLYKLLLYEAGGQLPFHVDTEKETGVFAMLLLQLPTEQGYEGGKLLVKHNNEVKELDCHVVSALGFCYTVSFAHCPHQLGKITSGTKLSLTFSLVKRGFSLGCAQREFIPSQVRKAEAALEPWLEEVTERKFNVFGRKLCIPLQHKYTESNLSFAGLKGNDKIVADVLKDCTDKNKDKCLHLHLSLVIRNLYGDPSSCNYCDEDCCSPDDHLFITHVEDDDWNFGDVIGVDGKPASVAFQGLRVDFDKEDVCEEEDPFDFEPDEKEYDDNETTSSDPTLLYRYRKAMLVAWPKALSISIASERDVSGALNLLEETLEISDPNFGEQLRQIICYCGEKFSAVWGWNEDSSHDSVTPRLLVLCALSNMLEDVPHIIQLLSTPSDRFYHSCHDLKVRRPKVGVRNAEVAKAIAITVQAHGWDLVSLPIIDLAKVCALTQGESLAQLAEQLVCMGNMDAGALVAQTAFGVFQTHIPKLESQKMPECTWCQPLASIPGYPDTEKFLKGPERAYLQKGFQSFSEAKSFTEKYFNNIRRHFEYDNYSAIGKPLGKGDKALCFIQKTGCSFKASMEKWLKIQEEVKRLSLEQGKFRSTVFESSMGKTPEVSHTSAQPGNKRQRLETEGSEENSKSTWSYTAECP